MDIQTNYGSRLHRLLTIRLYTTRDLDKAVKSKFQYKLEGDTAVLRVLGVLNTVFGLRLIVLRRT